MLAAGPVGVVAATMRRYIDAGARHLVCRIGVLGPDGFLDQLNQLRMVKETLA